MAKKTRYDIPLSFVKQTHLTHEQYLSLQPFASVHPDQFWNNAAQQFISWSKPWEKTIQGSFAQGEVNWYVGGQLNACHNCLDRHLPARANQVAIIWEGDSPLQSKTLTYQELYREVCRFANVLKSFAIKKGDRVCIYLPMIVEAVIAMLACARIGAIHSVVFAGFSADSLKNRILDADCQTVITADGGMRAGKSILLKNNIDTALQSCPNVKQVIVVKHTSIEVNWDSKRDHWYHEKIESVDNECPYEIMDANDPLFILYTSGSTGSPKGVLHAIGGYMVYVAATHYYIFDYFEGDIYWCTADVGWITGHSYIVYGPLSNGATTLLFEGVPNYPTPARCWEIIDKHHVNIFYTAPTALRALRREGDGYVKSCSRKSLKLLGSVGEPINPDVWEWYYSVVGDNRCAVVDTWWQTETGGILIAPLPGATITKPGSATLPFLSIVPGIAAPTGQILEGEATGNLVITQPWPGMMKTIYGDHQRFVDTYFNKVPGCYFTGDEAHRDQDGYYWIYGRVDDLIKVSGHRLGTAEIENALLQHPAVSEAAVVGIPHEIKGQCIYAFVTCKTNIVPDDALKEALIQQVRTHLSPIATPDFIQWAPALPKTRSGKIMRRILRKIAENEVDDLGDTSTLADPSVIEELKQGVQR